MVLLCIFIEIINTVQTKYDRNYCQGKQDKCESAKHVRTFMHLKFNKSMIAMMMILSLEHEDLIRLEKRE